MIPLSLLSLALLLFQTQAIRPTVQIDITNPGAAESAAADQRDGLAAIVWADFSAGADGVYCSTTSDHGLSWRFPARVDLDTTGADKRLGEASVRVAGASVFAFWLDDRNGAGTDLYARVSRDAGFSWEPELRVDDGGAAGADPVLAFDATVNESGAGIAVAMIVAAAAGPVVRVAISTDAGLTFGVAVPVASATAAPRLRLRAQADELHLLWLDDPLLAGIFDVLYQRSLDLGTTWQPAALDVDGGFSATGDSLDLAVRGNALCAVWQESGALLPIRASFSSVGGSAWQAAPNPVGASTSSGTVAAHARVHLPEASAVVAWSDDRATPGLATPALAWTADAGATWTETPLSITSGIDPLLAGSQDSALFTAQWSSASLLEARVSRDATPAPLAAFTVRSVGNLSLRDVALRFDPLYDDYLAAWIERDASGFEHVYAAGYRIPQILPQGSFTAGGLVSFGVAQFGHHEVGMNFKIFAAAGRGGATLPQGDGRRTGLVPDGWYTLSQSTLALGGTIGAAGDGTSPTFNFPASIPPGTTMWFVAAAYVIGPLVFGSITDPRPVLVM
jgi:hypothetical protein